MVLEPETLLSAAWLRTAVVAQPPNKVIEADGALAALGTPLLNASR